MTTQGGGGGGHSKWLCECISVCVSSTAHIRDVAPDVDREEEEEEEGGSLRTLSEGAFDFNMLNIVICDTERQPGCLTCDESTGFKRKKKKK